MKDESYRKTIVFGIIVLLVGMGFIPSIIGNKDVVNVGYNRIGTAHMGIIPSSDTVNIGEDFNATIYIDPSEAVGGWEIYLLIFTQGIVNATEVSPGPEWTEYFDDGNIHNDTGNITKIQTLKFEDYPDYNHTACTINFTALQPGVCSIELVMVEIADIDFYKMNVTVHNTTVVVSSNQPPYTPSGPYPENGATGVSTDADLSWIGGDPDPGDTVTYDVFFGTTSPPPKIVSNQSGTTIDPGILDYCTTYYWKIVAWDNHDAYTEGPMWEFTTELAETELEIEITGGFGVHVVIRNVGDYDAIDVEWNVDITGGVLEGINWSDDGYVSILPPDGEMVVDIPLIIGLGRIEIAAAADASNAEAVSETKNGFIILFFVILR